MLAFKYITPMLWQWGQVIGYEYRDGVTGLDAQQAMDAADPLSLFHWDLTTANLRAQWAKDGVELNGCQGLNECSGRGWGGIATAKGNGACATADLHTCGGNNDCSAQGGCGFLSSVPGSGVLPPSEQWIPGENVGQGTGGCQTPIGALQVFDRTAAASINSQTGEGWTAAEKAALEALMGTSVWERARSLFGTRNNISPLPQPLGTDQYNGDARRKAVAPTSK
jgi:hypothetical protein